MKKKLLRIVKSIKLFFAQKNRIDPKFVPNHHSL